MERRQSGKGEPDLLRPPAGQPAWDRGHHNRRAGLNKGADPPHPGTLSSSILLVSGTEVTTIEGMGSTKEQIHPIQVILQPPAALWDRDHHNRRTGHYKVADPSIPPR
jgi:hypothetical protein